MSHSRLNITDEQLQEFCCRNRIKLLALFGSVLRDDFDAQHSDIDVLVEFEPDVQLGYEFFTIQQALSDLLNRPVDLFTPDSLHHAFRDEVLQEADVQYDAS